MLTAEEITAVKIKLPDGVEAVFVQRGGEWNTLTELRCVAPKALEGQLIITAPDHTEGGPMSMLFSRVFGRVGRRVVVMASPMLAANLKAMEASQVPAADENVEGRA